MMEDKSISLLFVIIFLAAIILGSYYAITNNVFGEIDKDTQKAIDDIKQLIKDLDRLKQQQDALKNNTKQFSSEEDQHNFTITINPTIPKICGLGQLSNGNYIEAQKNWCYTT